MWRKDECGAWIKRTHYGSDVSEFGWKILSVSPSGSSAVEELRPFHRENAFDRNLGHPICRVKADREGALATARLDTPRNKSGH